MSAARVLHPAAVLSEFCKIRAASPVSVSRNLPCGRQLNRIKRDLFGPSNPVEINKIFNEELEKHQERAIKKWGFDFRTGSPLSGNAQFIWERVSFQESSFAPEMYTLTRAAHVRPSSAAASPLDLLLDQRAERENYGIMRDSFGASTTDTDSYGEDDSQDDEAAPSSVVVFKVPAVATPSSPLSLQLRKRQPKITEYMKERKRLAQSPKTLRPAKRMRTSSGSSSGQISSHSTQTHSISAHFSLRSFQRNN